MLTRDIEQLMLPKHRSEQITSLIQESNETYIPQRALKAPDGIPIRVGMAGGLPNNSITSDLVSGCLSAKQACYGTCFAAKAFWGQGIDFGVRVENTLNKSLVEQDIDKLPTTQRYIRNGWNSDPSWNWEKGLELTRIVRDKGLLMIFISKAFRAIDESLMKGFVENKAEMRISLSGLDNNAQLKKRLEFILSYRDAGGVAIPVIMSACYNDEEMNKRQEFLVDWVLKNDFPAAENSLRFPIDAPVTSLIDLQKTQFIKDSNDVWSGRLFSDRLLFPTTTSMPDDYDGLSSGYASQIDKSQLKALFVDPVKTHDQVMSNPDGFVPPQKSGVPEYRT
ncbi:hypothetical protein M8998_15870 [Sphingobacterium sp. lm-10]|uniref:hypothetical protein n=1 Tax=Sphingobacterium sp. lm-10 TaxID=2944904 RepID=UPI0020210EB6|nr:hypothetical protein [Sphingobacterium sp. lm-10]MCL7989428.1 hypothetical protein [Sphingobacterium sp. lm-10]